MLSFVPGFGQKRLDKPRTSIAECFEDEAFSVITDTLAVRSLVLQLQQKKREIRLLPYGESGHFLTHLTNVDASFNTLSIQAHADAKDREAVQKIGLLHLGFSMGDVPSLFTLSWIGEDEFDGGFHYRLRFPDWVITTQLRSYVRVPLPHDESGGLKQFFGCKKLPVIRDISEGGVSFLLSAEEMTKIENKPIFFLSDLVQAVPSSPTIRLRLCHRVELPRKMFSVGAEFVALNGAQAQALRKILLQEQAQSLQKGV